MLNLSTIKHILFDMDGVLYRGQTVLPGVPDLLRLCDERGLAVATITNNATRTRQQYEEKLGKLGLPIRGEQVYTSSIITNTYLRDHYPRGTTVYAMGMTGLLDVVFADDYFVPQSHRPQVVVQGADFELTYEKLRLGCLALRAGADYIATNPDRTFPTEEGLVPGAGAMIAALVAATDREPRIIGKPQPTMFQVAMEMLGGTPETTLVIGDRLDTDIAGAHNAELPAVLVLTGVTNQEDLERSTVQPDMVINDLTELFDQFAAS
ncbi:MAG: HAD-IIA family hydrolase [Chloroflexaceae bacterium]|nr:HAD-IIA family hydrolase [Chloroflexaceae bacterium]